MAIKDKEILKKSMLIINDNQWETFLRLINESYHSKLQIKITVFDDLEDIDYIGAVERIDMFKGTIKLDNVKMYFTQIVSVKYSNKSLKRIL